MADIYDFKKEKANGKNGEYEHCVICWQKTSVKKDEPIEERPNYIEGVGQLCSKCAKKRRQ